MSFRARTKGFTRTFATFVRRVSFQARKVNIGGVLTRELRTETLDYACGNAYDVDKETMTDSLDGRSRFNACTHVKQKSFPLSMLTRYASKVPDPPPLSFLGSQWYEYGCSVGPISPVGGIWVGSTDAPLPSFSYPGIDWTNLVYQVGDSLDGHMRAGQNLLVSLAEIGQTVRMVKNPLGLTKFLTRKSHKWSLGKIMKSSAGKYLEYEFGWKNLYRDYLAIANVWEEVRHHQAYLRETAQKYTHLASRQTVNATNLNPSNVWSTRFSQQFNNVKFYITEATKTATFSLDVRRTAQQALWSNFDQVVARLGGRQLALALWDLVPFSFVVDWFTHINRYIEQRSIDWGRFDLRYVGYSTKETINAKAVLTTIATCQYSPPNVTVTAESGPYNVQTSYVRTAGFPAGTSSVGLFGNLTKTQIAEGIALIVQRL